MQTAGLRCIAPFPRVSPYTGEARERTEPPLGYVQVIGLKTPSTGPLTAWEAVMAQPRRSKVVHQITRISINQTSKVVAITYLLLLFLFIPLAYVADTTAPPEEQLGMLLWGLLPLIVAALTYVVTAVACAIYNWVAKHVGGIEFTLDPKEEVR